MKDKLSFDDIWKAFEEVGRRHKLADFRIAGIYLWPLMRDRLMRDVAETLGVYERREDPKPVGEAKSSVLAAFHESPIAVVPFLRRDAQGIDRFSQFIVDAFREAGTEPLVFGMGPDDLGSGRPHIEVLERDFLARYRGFAKLMVGPRISGAHRRKYLQILADLASLLDLDTGAKVTSRYVEFPRWLLVDFYAQRMGFKKFFKRAKVQTLVLVNAWKCGLIAGAQAAGVWVIEPQHGLLSDKLPLLSWPQEKYIPYLPNELLLWGEYWGDVVAAPSAVKRTVIGMPQQLLDLKNQNLQHKPGTVLIISQVQQTTALLDLAIRSAQANPEIKFVLKPHPQEKPITLGDISARVEQLPENLQFASPTAPALPMIARAEFVVGVHSMALIEAMALGAKVIAIKLPGYENVLPIVKRGDITLAEAGTSLTEELALARVAPNASEYFGPRVTTAELVSIIEGDNNG